MYKFACGIMYLLCLLIYVYIAITHELLDFYNVAYPGNSGWRLSFKQNTNTIDITLCLNGLLQRELEHVQVIYCLELCL